MKITMSNNAIEFSGFSPFTSTYDKVYVSFDENKFGINNSSIEDILNNLNFSWDGELYWFEKKDREVLLNSLDSWFSQEKNHQKLNELGISNCLLVKETPNGVCLIDTQYDMGSFIDRFIQEFTEKYPETIYKVYSDSHLTDNLYLGRENISDEFELFYFLYKENIIDVSFFLMAFGNESFSDEDNLYFKILPNDKEIYLHKLGLAEYSEDDVKDALESAEYELAETINKDCWVWCENEKKKEKVSAKNKNVLVNTVDEVIEMSYQSYLAKKMALQKKSAPKY